MDTTLEHSHSPDEIARRVNAKPEHFRIRDKFKKDESAFMTRKLADVQNIVAGLATENFSKMSKGTQDLMLASHEADWNVVQTAPFIEMSRDFRSSAQRLRDCGDKKNLDDATLAYFEVTLNCVLCHKYIRRNKFPFRE